MVPLAFLNNGTGHTNIYRIPSLATMITGHLTGSKTTISEFSSWGSLFVAIRSLSSYHRTKDPQVRFAVIDTRRFPNNGIYHVPDLMNAGFATGPYVHEYLVHGRLQGGPHSGYSSVLWTDLVRLGIQSLIPKPTSRIGHLRTFVPDDQPIAALTLDEARRAKRVAEPFGSEFVAPVTAAVLVHVHRSWQRGGTKAVIREVQMLFIRKAMWRFGR